MFKTILLLHLLYTTTCSFELTILHTNQINSKFEMFNEKGAACKAGETCYGGVVRIGSYVKQVRARESNVLLLDTGDHFQGTFWYFALNKLNYTAYNLGNKDFDNGLEGLRLLFSNVNVPILCSNMITYDEVPAFIKKSVKDHIVVEVGGRKVGITGYVTSLVTDISTTDFLQFEAEAYSLQRVAQKLTKQGINIIIAVGHSKLDKDKTMATEIPEVDVIVSGNSRSLMYNGKPPTKETVTGSFPFEVKRKQSKGLIVQGGSYGKYVGTLKVTFDDNGKILHWSGNPVLMDSSIPEDKDFKKEMNQLIKKEKISHINVVGSTAMHFENKNYECRMKECEMGNMFTDAMMDYVDWNENLEADLAIINSGAFRADLDKGEIKHEDVTAVFPFKNTLALVKLHGSNLRKVFEQSVKDFSLNIKHGKFLQVSKVFVKYNFARPNGQRVEDLQVYNEKSKKYEKVSDDKEYTVLLSSFMAKGGDGYDILKGHKNLLSTNPTLVNVLFDYFKSNSPIKAELEGRINGMGTFPKWNEKYKEVQWKHKDNSLSGFRATLLPIITPIVAKLFV